MLGQAEFLDLPIGLNPLPDETLFSWCSRYHRLTANGLDATTCIQLFGHPRIGSGHDFPARIDVLLEKSNGVLGTAEQIIRDRTLLPFYLPFKQPYLAQQAVAAMRGNGIGHLKYQLGLLTGGLGAAHPLKACPSCMQYDLDKFGWSYWHRSHQLPGAWWCLKHKVPLQVSHLRLEQLARFSWVLPMPAQCAPVACVEQMATTTSKQKKWLLELAKLSCATINYEIAHFSEPIRIAGAIRHRMQDMGMTHTSGRIRWQTVEPWLSQLATRLACVPEMSQQADKALLRGQLAQLLSVGALCHPLKYLMWIATWFDGLEDFRKEYEYIASDMDESSAAREAATRKPVIGPNPEQSRILMTAIQGKISLTAAAKQSGVSYATIASWASRESFAPPRRPKKLDTEIWNRAVGMLRDGAEKMEISRICQLSVVTVTRILRTVPGLQEHWHQVRHEQRRAEARGAWKNVANLHTYLGLKALRRLEPAAYAWLYRNDRSWLTTSLENVPKTPAANHAQSRMLKTDTRMADALRRIALSRHEATLPFSLQEFKRSMPALAKAIRNPERWPLTIKALGVALTASRFRQDFLRNPVSH